MRPRNSILRPAILLTLSALVAAALLVAGAAPASGRAPSPGLRSFTPAEDAGKRLGLTYGPFLGMRCQDLDYRHCERFGIDLVLRRAATRVLATVGLQSIRLRTPGQHDGVRAHDWVGTFTEAKIGKPVDPGPPGQDLARVTVELRVRFADGRSVRAFVPHVLLTPGWG